MRLKVPKGQHAAHKKDYSSHDSLKGWLLIANAMEYSHGGTCHRFVLSFLQSYPHFCIATDTHQIHPGTKLYED